MPEMSRQLRMGEDLPGDSGSPAARDVRERAMNDLWNRTLSQVHSSFGKIVYLASLRNENTGRYEHFGLAQIYSDAAADAVLRRSHDVVFREWLGYSLEEQKRDLENYLETMADDRGTVLNTWLTLSPYQRLLPASASEAERELYITDLELILELLRHETSASASA